MSHAKHLYLDHPHERDHKEPGQAWATSSVDTRDMFNYFLPLQSNVTGPDGRPCKTKTKRCRSLRRPDNIVGISGPTLLGYTLGRSPETVLYGFLEQAK